MPLEPTTTLLTAAVIFLAALVHGIAGFGFAQVSLGLLPLFRDPATASVLFTATAIASNGRVFWSVREEFEPADWTVPALGLLVGMPLGILIFTGLDAAGLRLAIGATLLLTVAVIAATEKSRAVTGWMARTDYAPGRIAAFLVGLAAGVLGGAVALPGPPVILYGTFLLASGVWTGRRMKAMFTAFFGTLMVYRLASLAVAGSVTTGILLEAVVMVPALLLGAWAGIAVFDRVPEDVFTWIVLAGLTANAVILVLGALG